jgi:hypothetical protein
MSEDKSPEETPGGALVPQPHGGAIRRGSEKGNTPGTGRPPDEFKAAMRALASSEAMLNHVQDVLNNPDHPQWLGAWKWATERGYGKSPDSLEVSGPGGGAVPLEMVVRFVKPMEPDADG